MLDNKQNIKKTAEQGCQVDAIDSPHVGCKHLDYEGNYKDCKLIEGPNGWKWWERGETWTTYEGAPKNVQFCKLRGRINEIFACIDPGEMSCYEE